MLRGVYGSFGSSYWLALGHAVQYIFLEHDVRRLGDVNPMQKC